MPFTVEEFQDLIRILEEKPEWRARLRQQVLTEELLSLPEQMASLRAETERRFQELAAQVAELVEAQKRTDAQLAALTTQVAELTQAVSVLTADVGELKSDVGVLKRDVGDLKGIVLETDYRTKGPAYFGRMIRRAHVLSPDELTSLIEAAVESGTLSDAQAQDIYEADVVVRERGREDGAEVYLVVEVSWGVGTDDVTRAARRAILLAYTGVTAIPVVAGKWATDDAKWLARAEQVWQLTDGRAIPPELSHPD